MKKNLAILGAGRIGQVHARAIASNESAVLAAVYDPVEAAVQSVVNRFGGKPATIDEIVQDKSIDAVILCTHSIRLQTRKDCPCRTSFQLGCLRWVV